MDCFFAVSTLANDVRVIFVLQQAADELSRQRLIVNDHNFYYSTSHHEFPIASTRRRLSGSNGISIITARPPSATLTSSILQESPYICSSRARTLGNPL